MSRDPEPAKRFAPDAEPARGPGLRLQLMLALGAAFAVSALLLGLAGARLAERALELERRQGAEAAVALALAAEPLDEAHLEALVTHPAIASLRVEREGEPAPPPPRGASTLTRDIEGGRLHITLEPPGSATRSSLAGLFFLYAIVTLTGLLIFSYFWMTRSVVRPVEALTLAADRLTRGDEARVSAAGAAEISRLAAAFNTMQAELAREREAREARLEELERATAELETAERSLVRSEKMASVGRLAAGVAHEIGNPLAAILGLLELVRAGELEAEEEREFLARIERETERIHQTIGDLLDFARMEPAEDEDHARCDVGAVVEDALRLVTPQKDLRKVRIDRVLEEGLPRVRGSEARLAQVVVNLLLNAADAIDGEGTIRVEVALEGETHVRLEVSDDGPGIPTEIRETLFEPFVTTKPTGEGTGLGLAVCQTLIEGMKGEIVADDAPGGGARFVIRLRAAQAPASRPEARERLPSRSRAAPT